MQSSAETIRQQEQFDAGSHIKAVIGVRLGYYNHPLAAEITKLIDSPHAIPSPQEGLDASRGSLEALAAGETEQARSKYADMVNRDYPRVYLNEVKKAIPDYNTLDQHAVAEEVVNSRQNLMQAVGQAQSETNITEIVSEDELSKAADQARQENINRVIEQTDYIAQALVMRQGRVGSMVLNVLRKDLFEPFPTRSGSANLHRALQSLLDSASALVSADLFGEQVAERFRGQVSNHVHAQIRHACTALTEKALSDLIAQLQAMDPTQSPTVNFADSSLLANGDEIAQTDGSNSNKESSVSNADQPNPYQWRREANDRISTASAEQGESEPLTIDLVGLGKKLGSRTGSVYTMKFLAASTDGEKPLEILTQALMDNGDINDWLKVHPYTQPDIQNLLASLLRNPGMVGTEQLKRKDLSVITPGNERPTHVPCRRLNPRQTETIGEGFANPITEQFRMYYFVIDIEGQKALVVYKAGNKSNFTGHFERHM